MTLLELHEDEIYDVEHGLRYLWIESNDNKMFSHISIEGTASPDGVVIGNHHGEATRLWAWLVDKSQSLTF